MGEAHHHGPWVVARARRAFHGLGHPGLASPAARVADAEAHVLARASALPALLSLAHLVHFLQPDNTRLRVRSQVLPAGQSSSGELASPSVSSQQRSAWSALMIAMFMTTSGGFSGSSSSASDTSMAM